MNDFHIPEATPAPVYVDGREAPPHLARSVRRGWIAGIVYGLLQAAVLVGYAVSGDLAGLGVMLGTLQLAAFALLVWCVRRWMLVPAWLLFAYPIANAFASLFLTGPDRPGYSAANAHPSSAFPYFLVFFAVWFGKAAIAIRQFRKSESGTFR